ncbi:hypothetical protein LJ737_06545 [Hymenobacter sp. 15J16-1T3B]|uniref:hypothetical protein n=1 Tax=Hymenobacter sp. 15J16-1T3B TaxID=2886941 RepID=UPI001D105C9B|nr:hypothetical protein [Hymenobacter sp. 15J16-1T3B]MCC3156887.1 hypothetical protein [Hymenobacter sp. 15J16-1T3B]
MELLATFPFLRLHLHTTGHRALEAEWRGFVSSAFLRQALTEALGLARKHRVQAWIADDRRLGPVRPTDLEWVVTTVVPEFVALGIDRFAMIEAEDPLNKLLISNAADTVTRELPLQVRRFTDPDEARRWACQLD